MESPIPLLFKFKVAGIAIPVVFSVGLAMLTYYRFAIAEFCFFLAGVWTLMMWRSSEYLQQGANEVKRLRKLSDRENAKPKTVERYKTVRRQLFFYERSISIVIGLVTIGSILWMGIEANRFELSLLQGTIYSSNEPIPKTGCSVGHKDALLVFLGDQVAVIETFPRSIFRAKGVDLLTIEKNTDGSMAFSLNVVDSNNKIIAQIEKGEFTINPNNSYKKRIDLIEAICKYLIKQGRWFSISTTSIRVQCGLTFHLTGWMSLEAIWRRPRSA